MYKSWEKQESYSFRVIWLSKKQERLEIAKELLLRQMAKGEKIPEMLQIELETSKINSSRPDGWHFFMSVDSMRSFDTFSALLQYIKMFLKTSKLGAGPLEFFFVDEIAPVSLSKAQRIKLSEAFIQNIEQHPFRQEGREFFERVEPFKQYALSLIVEWSNFRRFIDVPFAAEDNPLQSLVGEVCRVEALPFEAEEKEKPQVLAEGILSLHNNTVTVGTWEQVFAQEDEIFESVAYYEVNIASQNLKTAFYISAVNRNEDEE